MNVSDSNSLRHRLALWVDSSRVRHVIIFLIVINAIILGMETSPTLTERYGFWLRFLDTLILSVFVLEIALKLYAFGKQFFRSSWNIFDFLVVGLALLPATADVFSVLRILRVLRVLRLISMLPKLRFVVEALLKTLPGISAIGGLLLVLFYIFAVIATTLFGSQFPQWFGNLAQSMYTLFQIMTLESWSMGIARPVMAEFPYAWIFFITFILIATFTMLNLFVAIIVDTMHSLHERELAEESTSLEQQLRALRSEIESLKILLKQQNNQ